MFIRASLGRGQGGMVGLGKNKWPNVDVDDGEHFISSREVLLFTWNYSCGHLHCAL